MSEFLKDLEQCKPGDDMPPINLGPYDNPLLWNKLDPYGADRSHQRRPTSMSRTMMEMYNIPLEFRDQCAHRYLPWQKCLETITATSFGSIWCSEFQEAWKFCEVYEHYRFELLKNKFMEYSKNYTTEDKNFFPSLTHVCQPFERLTALYWSIVASERLSGWDERDPANPLMNREPNRAFMRKLSDTTEWEESVMSFAMFKKRIDDKVVHDMVPGFPLPEDKRPTADS